VNRTTISDLESAILNAFLMRQHMRSFQSISYNVKSENNLDQA